MKFYCFMCTDVLSLSSKLILFLDGSDLLHSYGWMHNIKLGLALATNVGCKLDTVYEHTVGPTATVGI